MGFSQQVLVVWLIVFLVHYAEASYKCIVVAGADNVNLSFGNSSSRADTIAPFIEVIIEFDDDKASTTTYTTIKEPINQTMNLGVWNYSQNLSNPRWMNTKCFYKPIKSISFIIHSCDDNNCKYNTFQISTASYKFTSDYEDNYNIATDTDDSGILSESNIKLNGCSSCSATLYYRLYRSFGPCLSLNYLRYLSLTNSESQLSYASIWVQKSNNNDKLPPPYLSNLKDKQTSTEMNLYDINFISSFNAIDKDDKHIKNHDLDGSLAYYDFHNSDSFDAGLLICTPYDTWLRISIDIFGNGVEDTNEIYAFSQLLYFNFLKYDDMNDTLLLFPSGFNASVTPNAGKCRKEDYALESQFDDDVILDYSLIWRDCKPKGIDDDNSNKSGFSNVIFDLQNGTAFFFFALSALCIILILIGLILWKYRYKGGDFLNGFAVIWMLMEVWDFWSDILFVLLLFSLSIWHLFVPGILFILIPYIANLYYLAVNTKRWSTGNAPHSPRKWLIYWSWVLVTLTMITGGVHPAIELCNSALFPFDVFCMHLSYNEIIRIRTERFLTNVIIENLPQVVIQIIYLTSPYYSSSGQEWVVIGTLLSSVSSIIFSATFYFSNFTRDIPNNPSYKFEIILQSQAIEDAEHLTHAHWNIATAVQKAFGHRDPNYIIVDDVTRLNDELTMKGRVLADIIFEDNDEAKQMKSIEFGKLNFVKKGKLKEKLQTAMSELLMIDKDELKVTTFTVDKLKNQDDNVLFDSASVIKKPLFLDNMMPNNIKKDISADTDAGVDDHDPEHGRTTSKLALTKHAQ